jgi:hypothetical protein
MPNNKKKESAKMFQNFLDGKKKYSAFIITILATLIPLFVQDPEAQKTVMDFVPTVAALIAGVIYIITQGNIDKAKEQTRVANGQSATVAAAQATATQAAKVSEIVTAAIQTAQVENTTPLDLKLFHERVLNDVAAHYKEVNPATVFYEARDKGSVTTAQNMQQVVDYWDYLVSLAYPMTEYVKEQTEKAATGPCKGVAAPELIAAQHDLSNILKFKDSVALLAKTTVDWRKRMGNNDTLYLVGVYASQLLS